MFEKLKFGSTDEEKEFSKFCELKGKYLHKHIYDILIDMTDTDEISYCELSSVIKYDKKLRDTLYIYLATAEEKIRSDILNKYDVDCIKKYSLKNIKDLLNDLKPINNSENSNLYWCFELDLGCVGKIVKKFNAYPGDQIDLIDKIRRLRNKVMHHSTLILGDSRTCTEVKGNLIIITDYIKALRDFLPIEYRKGFQREINGLRLKANNKSSNMKKIYIGEI